MPDDATGSSTVTERAKSAYDTHGEKLRYLIAGAWNTLFSILLFNLLLTVFGHERYVLLFWASWVVAVVQSTFTLKYFAFRSKGRLLPQLGRAYLVYLPAQAISTVILWAGVQFLTSAGLTQNLAARVSQLLAVAITTVFSYIGHKYFTFRLPLEVGEVPPEDMIEGPAAIR